MPVTPAPPPSPDLAPPADVVVAQRAHLRALLLTTITAAIGPTLLVIAPFPVPLLLVPALVLVELALLLRRRALVTCALRCALGCSIVIIAARMPVKAEDEIIVTGLPTTPTTIAALNETWLVGMNVQWRLSTTNEQRTVTFSRSHLTLRAFLDELSDQLDTRVWVGRCGTGATILFGAAPMSGAFVDDT